MLVLEQFFVSRCLLSMLSVLSRGKCDGSHNRSGKQKIHDIFMFSTKYILIKNVAWLYFYWPFSQQTSWHDFPAFPKIMFMASSGGQTVGRQKFWCRIWRCSRCSMPSSVYSYGKYGDTYEHIENSSSSKWLSTIL